MVVKERIVVDLVFTEVKTCVNTVKDWFVSKGYKKITARNPDRWSMAVILDIAKGGLMSKTTIQASFKSHAGGNSIMLEFVASHDGTGLSGKPVISAAQDPKDKAYDSLAMELSNFVKTTWKRGAGPGIDMTTMAPVTSTYQPSTPTSGGYKSPLLSGSQDYSSQQSYGSEQQYGYQEQAQTGYDASGGYSQEQQPAYDQQQYQEQQPAEPVQEQPAPVQPVSEPVMSDEELAALEAQMAADEAREKAEREAALAAQAQPEPAPEPQVEAPVAEPAPPAPEPVVEPGPPVPEPVVEAPVPEPQPPVYEPPPQAEPAPVTVEPKPVPVQEPTPEVTPPPIVGPTAPTPSPATETFCPGCGKKTKPKWKTCPYCEHDLAPTKAETPAAQPEAAQPAPVAEQPAAQPEAQPAEAAPQVEQQVVTAGEATATCPVCPGCGQPPAWIDDYQRYYCYSCQKYV